jgi:hypothetical protein
MRQRQLRAAREKLRARKKQGLISPLLFAFEILF